MVSTEMVCWCNQVGNCPLRPMGPHDLTSLFHVWFSAYWHCSRCMQSRVSVTIGYLSVRLSIPPFGCCTPLWWVCRCGCSWQEIVIAAWLSGWVLVWLSVWSEVQTCISSSWCHCHSLSLASVKRVCVCGWVWVCVCVHCCMAGTTLSSNCKQCHFVSWDRKQKTDMLSML